MNIDKLKKKQEEINQRKEGYRKDFWFPKEGMNSIRIMPHWSGDTEEECWLETMYHKNIGPDKKALVCRKFQLKEQCPICEAVEALFKTKDKEDAAYAKKIMGKRRVYWNVVDLKDLEKGVQVWMTGTDIQDTVIDYCTNPKWGDITHPITGRNIDVKFTPKEKTKSGYNEYTVTPEPSVSEIADVQWLAKLNDLTVFIKVPTFDEMHALFYGEDQEQQPDNKPADPAPPAAQPAAKGPEPQPDPPKNPDAEKGCFKNAKFSSDDAECLACGVKIHCQERKVAKQTGTMPPATPPASAVPPAGTKAEEVAAPVTKPPEALKSPSTKETEIQNMLISIRNKAKKE